MAKVPVLSGKGGPHVTVIDSGYQWDPAWGSNPLDQCIRATNPVKVAQQLPTLGGAPTAGFPYGAPAPWKAGTLDTPGKRVAGALPALAGHANFIAGLIADSIQGDCPDARLTIRSHNGSFIAAANGRYQLPTEVTVARSLCETAMATPKTHVIDLGFAFEAFNNAPSPVWFAAFSLLTSLGGNPLIVAPAGNQWDTGRRYPAAFATSPPAELPPGFAGVVSVGSKDNPAWPLPTPPGLPEPRFSNHGPWVVCSADGNDVLSTFLKLNVPLEDAHDNTKLENFTSMAYWNGTSFAAPKVVAAICKEAAKSKVDARTAWGKIAAAGGAKDPDLGIILPF